MKRMWTKKAVDENAVDAVKTAIESGEIEVASNNLIAILSGQATDYEIDQDMLYLDFVPQHELDLPLNNYQYHIKGYAQCLDGAYPISFYFELSNVCGYVMYARHSTTENAVYVNDGVYFDETIVNENGEIELTIAADDFQLNGSVSASITAYIFSPNDFQ